MVKEFSEAVLVHAAADREAATIIQKQFEDNGFRVWLVVPEDEQAAGFASRLLTQPHCRYVVLLLTSRLLRDEFFQSSFSTDFVQLLQAQLVVLPILYEDCPVPEPLEPLQYLDLRNSTQRDLRAIVDAMLSHEREPRESATQSFWRQEGLSPHTLGQTTRRLIQAINNTDPLYLGMDLGGTKAYVSLMLPSSERVFDRKFTTEGHNNVASLVHFIKDCLHQAIDGIATVTGRDRDDVIGRVRAIGIAFPGPCDFRTGRVFHAPNLGVSDLPLAQVVMEEFGVPVYLDNDVNLGLLGETWNGVAIEYRNVVAVIIGTGIGGGILIGGSLYRGAHNVAGEIGHVVVDVQSDAQCGCGRNGCFEALASRRAMARDIQARKAQRGQTGLAWQEKNLGSNEIAYYYRNRDPETLAVVNKAAEVCGSVVCSLVRILNPEMIVFSGGLVLQLGEPFMSIVRSSASTCMQGLSAVGSDSVIIALGEHDNPMLVGACRLASASTSSSGSEDVDPIATAVADIDEADVEVLRSIGDASIPIPISHDPASDFYVKRMKRLRRVGLIETDQGRPFSESESVRLTPVGRRVLRGRSDVRE